MPVSLLDLTDAARSLRPRVAIVLGSGWGMLSERCAIRRELAYLDVPDLGATAVPGHGGRILLGAWADQPVLIFSGRLHFYEGHLWRTVCQPVHIAHHLGVEIIVLTNAAGGIRADLRPGSLMALEGHLSFIGRDCWRPFVAADGFPAVREPYCPRLRAALVNTGRDIGVPVTTGVYAQMTGPSYETPAEIRALRQCGADAVGMSTGKESEAAHTLGLRCVGLSCITNCAAGLAEGTISHEEVTATAKAHAERLAAVLERFLHQVA
ncbi:MAG: purine-nucleoside phosphorylase [Gemmataceae bacterium]